MLIVKLPSYIRIMNCRVHGLERLKYWHRQFCVNSYFFRLEFLFHHLTFKYLSNLQDFNIFLKQIKSIKFKRSISTKFKLTQVCRFSNCKLAVQNKPVREVFIFLLKIGLFFVCTQCTLYSKPVNQYITDHVLV